MRRVLSLAIAGALVSVPLAFAQPPQGEARVLNLAALTAAAERSSPGLRAARHSIAGASARVDEANWSPFFQFTATGSLAAVPNADRLSGDFPINEGLGPAVRVAVEGAVPLWTFGKIGAGRDAARSGLDAARLKRDQSRDELRLNVRRAYFALQLALDTEQMLNEGRPRLQRAVERIEERIEAGDPDANEMDRWRLSSTLAEIEGRVSETERLRESSLAALRILTGIREIRIPDCPIERISYEPRPLEWYVHEALDGRPESRQLRAGVEAREANLTATQARFLPDIALGLSASVARAPGVESPDGFFVYDPLNSESVGAALVARWSLDFVGNEARTRRANEELLETTSLVDEARRGIALDVATTFLELADAGRRERAWASGHRDSRAWFVAAAQAYQVGTIEPRDLVDAVRAYFTARFNHLNAIRDYDTALAKLERAVGHQLVPPDGWEPACE